MNHPGPWSIVFDCAEGEDPVPSHIVDADGNWVIGGETVELDSGGEVPANIEFASDRARQLILAVPVLLDGMRALLSDDAPRDVTPFNLLVDYLDGKPGANQIDLGEFLKWLRTGRGAVVTTDYRDVEGERDELLVALKEVLVGLPGARTPARALVERIEKGR